MQALHTAHESDAAVCRLQVRRLLGSCAPVVLAHAGAAPEAAGPERAAAQQVAESSFGGPSCPAVSQVDVTRLCPRTLQLLRCVPGRRCG